MLEHEDFLWKDIAISLRRAQSYRNKKNFKKWFYGLNITQLRQIIKKENFDWDILKELANEFKADHSDSDTIKGIPIDKWIKWFVRDVCMKYISQIINYSSVSSFRSSWIKQDRVSIFQKRFSQSYSQAVIKYRRKRTIELLTDRDFINTL